MYPHRSLVEQQPVAAISTPIARVMRKTVISKVSSWDTGCRLISSVCR
jgi:hypothetical protein